MLRPDFSAKGDWHSGSPSATRAGPQLYRLRCQMALAEQNLSSTMWSCKWFGPGRASLTKQGSIGALTQRGWTFKRDCKAVSGRTPASLARGEPTSCTGRFTPLKVFVHLPPKHLSHGGSPATPRALTWQAHLCGTAHMCPPETLLPALLGHSACQCGSGTTLLARGVLVLFMAQHFTTENVLIFMQCPPLHPRLLPCGDEFPLAAPRSWKNRQNGIKGFKLAQWR